MTDTRARSAGPAERAHHTGDDGPAPAGGDWRGRRRMSAKRKQGAVLRLLRGEDRELVSRGHCHVNGPWRSGSGVGKNNGMRKKPDPHHRHRFPAEIIAHAVWLRVHA